MRPHQDEEIDLNLSLDVNNPSVPARRTRRVRRRDARNNREHSEASGSQRRVMIPEAYLHALLEQIAVRAGALSPGQTEQSDSGSSLVSQREHELAPRVATQENHPETIQHDFLGHRDRIKRSVETPHGVTGNTVPRGRSIATRITRSNPPVASQPDLRDRLNSRRQS